MTLVAIDTKTTGLDAERHDIWEIACIVRGHRDPLLNGEWLWQVRPNLSSADPGGLRIGRFYQRFDLYDGESAALLRDPAGNQHATRGKGEVAERIAELPPGACAWLDHEVTA